jgi:hypothetical protein
MATPVCYYATWGAYAFGWTHFFPTIMTLFFSTISVIYSEFFFLLIGVYFKGVTHLLHIAQQSLEVMRPDPYCAVYHTYAYPSTEVFYAVSLLVLVVTYVLSDERPCQVGIWGWICALAIAFLTPSLLVWNTMNTLTEVLSTALLATIPTVAIMLLLRFVVQPNIGYLIHSPPVSWFGYQSHFLPADPAQIELANWAKIWREKNY